MDALEVIDRIRETYSARRVFGEPIQQNGATVLPVARVRGGGGGGQGENPEQHGKGAGTGFGVNAEPVGVYEIRGGEVRWKPAFDVSRIILRQQIVMMVALLAVGRVLALKWSGNRSRRGLLRLLG
ncbi:MAG: hypothetical protein IRZ16_01215 [Myxococcaceae bacterium]|nr:hypothetical protein [Myxococcaceae bacterium]